MQQASEKYTLIHRSNELNIQHAYTEKVYSHASSKDKRPLLFSRSCCLFHTCSLARHSTSCIWIHLYIYTYIGMACIYWLCVNGWLEHVLCELQQAITLVRLNCIRSPIHFVYEMRADEWERKTKQATRSRYLCIRYLVYGVSAVACICVSWAKESRTKTLLTSERDSQRERAV